MTSSRVRRGTRRRILTSLLLLTTRGAFAVAQDPDVLMGRFGIHAPAHVYFITAPQLSRLDQLSEKQAEGLRYSPSKVLAEARRAKAIFLAEGCKNAPSPEWSLGLTPVPADTVAYVFRASAVSFVGRVVGITPGWMPSTGSPSGSVGTMFTMVVTEIIRDDTKALKPGTRVAVNRRGGEFTFEGTVFCTRNPYVSPVSLEQFLVVAASPSELNGPRVFETGFMMSLEGDEAIALERPMNPRGGEPRKLEELRAAASQPEKNPPE